MTNATIIAEIHLDTKGLKAKLDLILEQLKLGTATDFSKPQDPPAWMYFERTHIPLPNPLEFKKVAWMRRESIKEGEYVVWICLIGGEPMGIKTFTEKTAISLVKAWEDYRVGLPLAKGETQ